MFISSFRTEREIEKRVGERVVRDSTFFSFLEWGETESTWYVGH
jgi:hypothetical protein